MRKNATHANSLLRLKLMPEKLISFNSHRSLMASVFCRCVGGPRNAQPKLPWCWRKREVKELTKIGYQEVRTYQHNITDSLDCSTKSVRVLCGSMRVRRTKMVFDQTQRVFIFEHYFRTQLYPQKSLHFPVKTVKLSCINWQIFFKKS